MRLIKCDACDGRGNMLTFGGFKEVCLSCKGSKSVECKDELIVSASSIDKRSKEYREMKKRKEA